MGVVCKYIDIEKRLLITAATYRHPRSTWKNSFNGKSCSFLTFGTSKSQDYFSKK